MWLSTFTYTLLLLLLPSLASPSVVFPRPAVPHSPSDARIPSPTPILCPPSATPPLVPAPTPNPLSLNPENLELREVVAGAAATLAPGQVSPITTQWVESVINGVATWIEIIYTQTFAAVPEQLATAGKGEIGMGTLTGQVGVTKTYGGGGAAVETGRVWARGVVVAGAVVVVGGLVG